MKQAGISMKQRARTLKSYSGSSAHNPLGYLR